jgi:hypothetical protein
MRASAISVGKYLLICAHLGMKRLWSHDSALVAAPKRATTFTKRFETLLLSHETAVATTDVYASLPAVSLPTLPGNVAAGNVRAHGPFS